MRVTSLGAPSPVLTSSTAIFLTEAGLTSQKSASLHTTKSLVTAKRRGRGRKRRPFLRQNPRMTKLNVREKRARVSSRTPPSSRSRQFSKCRTTTALKNPEPTPSLHSPVKLRVQFDAKRTPEKLRGRGRGRGKRRKWRRRGRR